MRFNDLRLDQQVGILRDMMDDSNTSLLDLFSPSETYVVPDTDYEINLDYSTVASGVMVSLATWDEFKVNSVLYLIKSETDTGDALKVTMNHNCIGGETLPENIDKFNLMGSIKISGSLESGLNQILKLCLSLETLISSAENPIAILTKMIELIPIAQGFPEELFDKMYIDETVVTDVKNLNNCIYNLLGQQGYQSASMTDPTISEYYNGRYTVVNPSHPNCRLYIEIGGERGDVFNVHVIDANKKEAILWKTRTLTGDDGSTDIVATLTNDVYQTIQESSNKEILLPLVKHFFRITAPAINNYHDSKEVDSVSN